MPATITATGPLGIPMDYCAQLVAASPTFRGVIDAALNLTPGTTTASQAMAYIFYPYVDQRPSSPAVRPWALICDDDLAEFAMDHHGAMGGSLVLTFQLLVNPSYIDAAFTILNAWNADLDFRNTVGAILTEMFQLANTPGPGGIHYWNLVKATKVTAPALCKEDDNDVPFYDCAFLLEWDR